MTKENSPQLLFWDTKNEVWHEYGVCFDGASIAAFAYNSNELCFYTALGILRGWLIFSPLQAQMQACRQDIQFFCWSKLQSDLCYHFVWSTQLASVEV